MTSRAPQSKASVPISSGSGAKKLGARAQLSREAAPTSVKRPARNLLKPPQMTTPDKESTERRATRGAAAHPSAASGSSSPSSSRKAAMSNKTASAKDTTQEYREDS